MGLDIPSRIRSRVFIGAHAINNERRVRRHEKEKGKENNKNTPSGPVAIFREHHPAGAVENLAEREIERDVLHFLRDSMSARL